MGIPFGYVPMERDFLFVNLSLVHLKLESSKAIKFTFAHQI